MKSENDVNPQQPVFTGASILAIISIVFAAGWIAFAYAKSNAADSDRITIITSDSPHPPDRAAHTYLPLDRHKEHCYFGNPDDRCVAFYSPIGSVDAFYFRVRFCLYLQISLERLPL